MLPSVLVRLLALKPGTDSYFDDLTKLAEEDPPMAVKMLRLANGSASAPRTPITSVRTAVARLGAADAVSVITAMSVTRVFVPTTDAQKSLWSHAIEVAACAQAIARMNPKLDAGSAYTCGLLHDIGRFSMFESAADAFREVEVMDTVTFADIRRSERDALGHDHCQLGFNACKKWALPEAFGRLILAHHDYGAVDADIAPMLRIVQVADLVSIHLFCEEGWETLDQDAIVDRLASRCVPEPWPRAPFDLAALASRLPAICGEVNNMVRVLGLA